MSEEKPKKKRPLKKRIKRWLYFNIAPFLVYITSEIIGRTSRWVVINAEPHLRALHRGEASVIGFWHSRSFLMPFIFRIEGGKRALVMVSRSEDGIFTAKVLKYFGIECSFGSSTRGGKEALEQMLTKYQKEAIVLAITPDGPLGPAEIVKPGIVLLAKETGLPIFTVSYYAKRVFRFKTWDRFVFIHPFNKIVAMTGDIIYVPKDANEQELEQCRQRIEAELKKITEIVENYYVKGEKLEGIPFFYSRVSVLTGKPVWTNPEGTKIKRFVQ